MFYSLVRTKLHFQIQRLVLVLFALILQRYNYYVQRNYSYQIYK